MILLTWKKWKKENIHTLPYKQKLCKKKENKFLFINSLQHISLSNDHLENPQLSSHGIFSKTQEKTEGKFPQLMQIYSFLFFLAPLTNENCLSKSNYQIKSHHKQNSSQIHHIIIIIIHLSGTLKISAENHNHNTSRHKKTSAAL